MDTNGNYITYGTVMNHPSLKGFYGNAGQKYNEARKADRELVKEGVKTGLVAGATVLPVLGSVSKAPKALNYIYKGISFLGKNIAEKGPLLKEVAQDAGQAIKTVVEGAQKYSYERAQMSMETISNWSLPKKNACGEWSGWGGNSLVRR